MDVKLNNKEEYKKCINSAYYFYTNYFYINNKPATTHLTEEEFNKRIDFVRTCSSFFGRYKKRVRI